MEKLDFLELDRKAVRTSGESRDKSPFLLGAFFGLGLIAGIGCTLALVSSEKAKALNKAPELILSRSERELEENQSEARLKLCRLQLSTKKDNLAICEIEKRSHKDEITDLKIKVKQAGSCYSPCDKGWTYWETLKTCYKVLTRPGGLNLTQADQECQANGGKLASIHSRQENLFVNALGAQNAAVDTELQTLLGGVRKIAGGMSDFEWLDGTPFDFTVWAPHEPDNLEQGCVKTWSTPLTHESKFYAPNTWDDDRCFSLYFNAICKKPAVL